MSWRGSRKSRTSGVLESVVHLELQASTYTQFRVISGLIRIRLPQRAPMRLEIRNVGWAGCNRHSNRLHPDRVHLRQIAQHRTGFAADDKPRADWPWPRAYFSIYARGPEHNVGKHWTRPVLREGLPDIIALQVATLNCACIAHRLRCG